MNENHSDASRRCPRCGRVFACGMLSGASRCWCADMPAVVPDGDGTSCYCPDCLRRVAAEQMATRQPRA